MFRWKMPFVSHSVHCKHGDSTEQLGTALCGFLVNLVGGGDRANQQDPTADDVPNQQTLGIFHSLVGETATVNLANFRDEGGKTLFQSGLRSIVIQRPVLKHPQQALHEQGQTEDFDAVSEGTNLCSLSVPECLQQRQQVRDWREVIPNKKSRFEHCF